MGFAEAEIASQPDCWRQAAELAGSQAGSLPAPGERVAVVGCGTSWFVAQAYAALREAAGLGETDAFAASAVPWSRRYDAVLALSRSGTTTEVVRALERLRDAARTVAVTAAPGVPVADLADHAVVLEFAAERSVVQTRFATSALALLRTQVGEDIDPVAEQAARVLAEPVPAGATERTQFTFLGTGWALGLANEAALKMREASLSWTESYPAMEYRHGPISITDERSLVWFLGGAPPGLAAQARGYGAQVVESGLDAMADLVAVQRLAVAIGRAKGLDPDRPRHLSHSVVLPAADPA